MRCSSTTPRALLDRRPELDALPAAPAAGGHPVVWRLDRLGRSLRHVDKMTALDERGLGFRSLRH